MRGFVGVLILIGCDHAAAPTPDVRELADEHPLVEISDVRIDLTGSQALVLLTTHAGPPCLRLDSGAAGTFGGWQLFVAEPGHQIDASTCAPPHLALATSSAREPRKYLQRQLTLHPLLPS